MTPKPAAELPLADLKVIDAATLFAGPAIATIMGDFGADVIKIDHPAGDDLRRTGWSKDGVGLWSLLVSRNKRCVSLKLSDPRGQDILKRLVTDADVLIENFRPGTLERWGIGPEVLHEINPGLVIVRTTGFGQTGPYSQQPGFGTLAEAISGYAHTNGYPDGPPTLPPFALADGIAGLTGTYATMFALWWREHGGTGQVIDLSLYEPLFWILGIQAPVYDQLGIVQERTGNELPFSAPRSVFRTADDEWVAISATARSIAERVMRIVGRGELIDEPWFESGPGRVEHAEELHGAIAEWIAVRSTAQVLEAFERGEAAIARIYSIREILADEHYAARETITTVDHPTLGPVKVPNAIPRLSLTPGRVERAGPEHAEHNAEVYTGELGIDEQKLSELREEGVI